MQLKLVLASLLTVSLIQPAFAADSNFESMSESQKWEYFEQNKKSADMNWLTFAPFGISAYTSGHTFAGGLITVLDLVALSSLAGGIATFIANADGNANVNGWGILGLAVAVPPYILGRMIGLSIDSQETEEYNANLKRELGLSDLSYSSVLVEPQLSYSWAF